jgi:quinoprotein glucose dehydrogenase
MEKPTIELPGIAGGVSYGCGLRSGNRRLLRHVSDVAITAELVPSNVSHTGYIGKMSPVKTMNGVPLWKPPYGRVTAIDLS